MAPPASSSLRCQLPPGKPVRFTLDGENLTAYDGDTIASAVLASGRKVLRRTPRRDEPRGLLCGIGICYECLVQVNGRPNVQACLTPVAEGMQVETQAGVGHWDVES